MITYQIPLVTYPDTYNKELLMYAAPASQKNRTAVYLPSMRSKLLPPLSRSSTGHRHAI